MITTADQSQPPRQAPLVIGFDLDLTLIDSRPGTGAVYRELAVRTGTHIDVDGAMDRLGPPLEVELALWYPADRIPEMVGLFRAIYPDHAVTTSPPLPGAASAIASVRERAGQVVVITGKYERNARLHLDHLGFAVDAVVGWAWAEGKTAAMRELGVGVYVGDHPDDMVATVVAGAIAVGVTTGSHTAAELTAAGAEVVLASLTEFPGWLARWLATVTDIGASALA